MTLAIVRGGALKVPSSPPRQPAGFVPRPVIVLPPGVKR
jgi:hypothetical protein